MNCHDWSHFLWVSPFFCESMKIIFSVYSVLLYFKKPTKVYFTQGLIATALISLNEAGDGAREKPATAIDVYLAENENDSNFGG